MTNYTKQPTFRPWARDVDAGDTLSPIQHRCLDHTRLGDFGLDTVELLSGNYRVVTKADRFGAR